MTQDSFTFTSPERTVELFLHCVGLLQVDDDGLVDGHDMADLNAAAFLCTMMKTLAIAPRDVLDILLFDLADATEALLPTAVLPPDGDVVTRWARARALVVQCQLDAL